MLNYLRFYFYKLRVIRELNYVLLLFVREGHRFDAYPEIRKLINECFQKEMPVFSAVIRCAAEMVEMVVVNIQLPDRNTIIEELPTLDYELLRRFISTLATTGKVVWPQPKLPGTFMIGSVMLYAGIFLMNKKIAISDRDAVMEQIYGVLVGLPVAQRQGANFQVLLPSLS